MKNNALLCNKNDKKFNAFLSQYVITEAVINRRSFIGGTLYHYAKAHCFNRKVLHEIGNAIELGGEFRAFDQEVEGPPIFSFKKRIEKNEN